MPVNESELIDQFLRKRISTVPVTNADAPPTPLNAARVLPITISGYPLRPVAGDVAVPITATSHVLPAGTVIVVINVVVPEPPETVPDTGASSTLPPSLPMISLVIANLNPRDLM